MKRQQLCGPSPRLSLNLNENNASHTHRSMGTSIHKSTFIDNIKMEMLIRLTKNVRKIYRSSTFLLFPPFCAFPLQHCDGQERQSAVYDYISHLSYFWSPLVIHQMLAKTTKAH